MIVTKVGVTGRRLRHGEGQLPSNFLFKADLVVEPPEVVHGHGGEVRSTHSCIGGTRWSGSLRVEDLLVGRETVVAVPDHVVVVVELMLQFLELLLLLD